jgi:hypothetical protein
LRLTSGPYHGERRSKIELSILGRYRQLMYVERALTILLLALAAPAAAQEGSVRINDDLQVEDLGDRRE